MKIAQKLKKASVMVATITLAFSVNVPSVYAAKTNKEVNDSKIAITASNVETFADMAFEENMAKYNIPGGILTVVKDGQILLSKGYGYADLEEKKPVVPNQTLFRIGSTTKLFTASAAMKLVEEGKVALNEPINNYIKGFEIPGDYDTPVTLAHLLTHTSGLDDSLIGDLAKEASEVQSLTEFYADYNWKSVREPGTIIQYNNRGMGAVGCIVEQISGIKCSTYIEDHIFTPLEMTNSSFKLQDENLSKAYIYDRLTKNYAQATLEGYFKVYPVGGILSTGNDIANFMIAHLNNGKFKNKTIIEPNMIEEMHKTQVRFSPYLPGMTYGFHEVFKNGERIIEHSGYTPDGFLTELALLPKQNIGLFVSINQGANNTFPQDFLMAFMDNYFQSTEKSSMEKDDIKKNIEKGTMHEVSGTYRSTDYISTNICKGDLIGNGQEVKVSMNQEGSITVEEEKMNYFDFKKTKISWQGIEVDPLVYKNIDKDEYIAFKKDAKGKVIYMSKTEDSSMAVYERIAWYDGNAFQVSLFMSLLGITFLEGFIWVFKGGLRGIKHLLKKEQKPMEARLGQHLVGSMALLNFGFYGISMYTWGYRMHYGVPLDVKLDLCMPLLAALCTLVLVVLNIPYWKNKVGSLPVRINVTFMTIVGMVFIWLNNYWNFIGFKF